MTNSPSSHDLLERLNHLKKVLNSLENKLESGKGFYQNENIIYHVINDIILEVETMLSYTFEEKRLK
jgi:hypothetical protein